MDDDTRSRKPDNVILEGVVGSTAYGMDTATSDIDTLGVFQAPTTTLLGLDWDTRYDSVVTHHPADSTWHELGKYVRLALAANPTVLELLWLPEHTVITPTGSRLIELRRCFLSQRVRVTYGGYARQQIQRLLRNHDSRNTPESDTKSGRHAQRLLFQLEHLLQTGEIKIRLDPAERDACFAAGKTAAEDPSELQQRFNTELARLDNLPTDLPETPDTATIGHYLVETRLADI